MALFAIHLFFVVGQIESGHNGNVLKFQNTIQIFISYLNLFFRLLSLQQPNLYIP